MKIICRGVDPKEHTWRGTCLNCKTLVEFSKAEARYNHDQRDGDYLTVTCPVCGGDIHSAVHQSWEGHQS